MAGSYSRITTHENGFLRLYEPIFCLTGKEKINNCLHRHDRKQWSSSSSGTESLIHQRNQRLIAQQIRSLFSALAQFLNEAESLTRTGIIRIPIVACQRPWKPWAFFNSSGTLGNPWTDEVEAVNTNKPHTSFRTRPYQWNRHRIPGSSRVRSYLSPLAIGYPYRRTRIERWQAINSNEKTNEIISSMDE
jgi:hypothetical protein